MDSSNYTRWVVGYNDVFLLTQRNCQKFLTALVASDSRIERCSSFGIRQHLERIQDIDACFLISIPNGNEEIFDRYIGKNIRKEPREMKLN